MKALDQLVEKTRAALGDNVISVVLYGETFIAVGAVRGAVREKISFERGVRDRRTEGGREIGFAVW